MSINWDTPVSELMHGDDTIGLFESDEALMHFKYIKREKKNGRWVYYYDQSELDAAKDRVKYFDLHAYKKHLKLDAAENRVKANRQIIAITKKQCAKRAKYIKAKKDYKHAKTVAKGADRASRYYKKKYNRMTIASFPARTVSRGLVKLGNLLSSMNKKVSK